MRTVQAGLALALLVAPALAQSPPRPRPAPPAADALTQPGRAGWLVDAGNGCWVWTTDPAPGVAVSWNGACHGGPGLGTGTIEWRWMENALPRLQRYVGPLRQGRMEGRGTLTLANGGRYEGEFANGRQNGRGILIAAGGGRYEGDFRDGLFHGAGTATWTDGTRYQGEFRENRPDGQGVAYSAQTGVWYRGTWAGGCYRAADGTRWALLRALAECP